MKTTAHEVMAKSLFDSLKSGAYLRTTWEDLSREEQDRWIAAAQKAITDMRHVGWRIEG